MGTYAPARFAPGRAAIVVVDVQNDFCHPEGVLGTVGADTSSAEAMVPRLETFLARAREAGTMVIFIQTTHDDTTDSPAWRARRGDPEAGVAPGPRTCFTGSWGAEFYEVGPEPGEPVVVKHRYSAFVGTNLDLILRSARIESLMFAGVATNVCVESTLRDGLFHDYHVTLVEDCSASYDKQDHDHTAATVADYFGVVASSEEIAATW